MKSRRAQAMYNDRALPRAFHDRLQETVAWSMVTPDEQTSAVVERLLQKLDASPGYAGVPGIAGTIGGLVDGDGNADKLIDAILCDPALTAKLLQLANYTERTISGRNVSTIDQALSILGPGKVKSIAAELLPLESLGNKPQLDQLHAEIMAAHFCGRLAAAITRTYAPQNSAREAQACGVLQNIGRLMALLYLYEDIERVHQVQIEQNIAEPQAVGQLLGTDFEKIGAAIVHDWGLSIILQNSLAPDTLVAPPEAAPNAAAWFKLCSLFCRRITAILFFLPEQTGQFEVVNCIDFFHQALHLREKETVSVIEKCLVEADATLAGMNFPFNLERARGLLRKSGDRTMDILLQHDPLVKDDGKGADQAPVESIKRVMRLIHEYCGFDCTLVCLPLGSGLIAVAGVGRNAAWLTTRFRSSGLKQDIFRAALAGSRDLFVPDVDAPPNAALIPQWYHQQVGAKSLVMLPLMYEGRWLGMVYGDFAETRSKPPEGMAEGRMADWRRELIQILLWEAEGIALKASEPRLRLAYLGQEYALDANCPALRIGRADGADILLQDPQASRMHATIEFRDGKFFYADRSSNGSFLRLISGPELKVHHAEVELKGEGSLCMGHAHAQGEQEYLEFLCQGGDEGADAQ